MNKTSLAVLPLVALFGVLIAYVLFTQWYILDVHTTDVTFTVVAGQHIGFALNKSLAFGTVPQGGSAGKKTTLTAAVPALVHVSVDLPWVYPEHHAVSLQPNVPQELGFTLQVPPTAPPGNYTGTVVLTYTRQLPWQ